MARPKNIDKQIVEDIRDLYRLGEHTQQELSRIFNLSQSTICKIINNNIHKYNSNITFSGEARVRVGYRYGN